MGWPVRDLEIIAEELRLKDIAHVEKEIEPLKKEVARDGKAKEKKDRLEAMTKILAVSPSVSKVGWWHE